jgi:hypothetical protein
MPEQAEELIVERLIEALERLRQDLDRVELWAGALGSFQDPVPEYQPGDQYLLSRRRSGPDPKSQGRPGQIFERLSPSD